MKVLLLTLLLLITPMGFAAEKTFSEAESTLPLEFNTGNQAPYGLPSTFITIGDRTFPIIVDTGASNIELVLSRYALGNTLIKFTGNEVCFMAFDGKHCQPEFIIPQIRIGSFILSNVRATLMSALWGGRDKDFVTTEASRNGVLGLKLLAKFNILIDFPQSKLTLIQPNSHPAHYNVTDWVPIPFQENLATQLKLNGKPLNLDWDTGSVPSIMKREVAANFKQVRCPLSTSYGEKNCLRVKTTSFTNTTDNRLPNTWFMIQDIPKSAPFDGLIGSNFFRENVVYIDFDQHKIFVKPKD